jgi:phosphate:Na+ symporter
MTQQWLQALGGLGLFLLAMLVMTEGLRGLAGEALHGWLTRATRSPSTGALTGTVVTALLQSSSATIVTTVGFVAAGLLSFSQALGVVLGANVGTTITGWLVALLGFKLALGVAAYPLVLFGMMLRIFGRRRWSETGKAIAGFGLLFVGIGFMQQGMGGLEGVLTPAGFPDDTFAGRLLLLVIGAALTMITQSSSAGVAVAMTALSVGGLNFSQAAAMVIGMDVGTTITAVLATIGSSEAARRTGYSHTVYNLFTAVLALLLLSPYVWLMHWWSPDFINDSAALALAGFHTLFNVAALVIGLPLAGAFARLMVWLIPAREEGLAARLDKRLLTEPKAAWVALEATLRDEFEYALAATEQSLDDQSLKPVPPLDQAIQEFADTRDYLDEMNRADSGDNQQQLTTAIHALEHLVRMVHHLQQYDLLRILRSEPVFTRPTRKLADVCARLRPALAQGIDPTLYAQCEQLAARLTGSMEAARDETIERAVNQELSIGRAGKVLAAYRWQERMAHHVWRVAAHLGGYDAEDDYQDDDEPD